MDLQITKEQFEECLQDFINLSDKIQDNWKLCTKGDSIYMNKESRYEIGSELISLDHHVIYNLSYGAPMLCFNGWKSNGNLLSLEECWNLMNLKEDDDRTTILTQVEHPALQKPFYGLHPCKTPEILQATFKNSKNIVVSWLSSVAPYVRLNLDIVYATLT